MSNYVKLMLNYVKLGETTLNNRMLNYVINRYKLDLFTMFDGQIDGHRPS